MDARVRQVAENEVRFRALNERLRAGAGTWEGSEGELNLVCECGDEDCVTAIALSSREYEAIRAVGTQFVVARPSARAVIVAVATVAHRLVMVGLQALIDLQWTGVSWGSLLVETGINAVAALVVFQAAQALPGAMARQRFSRRSSLSRRNW